MACEKSVTISMGNLIISSDLCQPPSEIICFRDLTLAASDKFDAILVECNGIEKDYVWQWLRRYGAMDFVDDLIIPYTVYGYSVRLDPAIYTNVLVESRLWQYNIHAIIKQVTR